MQAKRCETKQTIIHEECGSYFVLASGRGGSTVEAGMAVSISGDKNKSMIV